MLEANVQQASCLDACLVNARLVDFGLQCGNGLAEFFRLKFGYDLL